MNTVTNSLRFQKQQIHEYMSILGLDEFPFTINQLNSNFRKLIKICHPDVSNDPNATKHTVMVVEAKEYLLTFINAYNQSSKICDLCHGKGKISIKIPNITPICNSCRGGVIIYKCNQCGNNSNSNKCYECVKRDSCKCIGIDIAECPTCNGTGRISNMFRYEDIVCTKCKGSGYWNKYSI